jgi:hypothetical protein
MSLRGDRTSGTVGWIRRVWLFKAGTGAGAGAGTALLFTAAAGSGSGSGNL